MNVTNARSTTAEDLFLYRSIVMRLRNRPYEYRQLKTFFHDPAILLTLLQRMLEAGDVTATDLKHGLITEHSLISLT